MGIVLGDNNMSSFFEKMTEASEIKTKLVTKYFTAWSTIMKGRVAKLAYMDLFSGPGVYEDGTDSTPLLILNKIVADPALSSRVVTLFNDADPKSIDELKRRVSSLPNIENLKFKPIISNLEIDENIANQLKETRMIPTFGFVDPWGYKGLSVELVKALIKDWGSDCIFFFNYNRINAALNNHKVKEHMDAIFGPERVKYLQTLLPGLSKEERENLIVNELALLVSDNNKHFVLPFRFQKVSERTSHYLIFVSKNYLGYSIMKEIMYKASSELEDGVANFSYIPTKMKQLEILFSYSRPLDELGADLLNHFTGKTMSTKEIFDSHNVGTPFVLQNYKEALRRLEASESIEVNPPSHKRRKGKDGVLTFGDKVIVTFP